LTSFEWFLVKKIVVNHVIAAWIFVWAVIERIIVLKDGIILVTF